MGGAVRIRPIARVVKVMQGVVARPLGLSCTTNQRPLGAVIVTGGAVYVAICAQVTPFSGSFAGI